MSLSEQIKTPRFGDMVENGWASEENPTRRGYFVRAYTTTGRMNPGLHWQITDKRGKFWDLQPKAIADRLTVTPCQEGSAEYDGAAMRHTLSVQATDKSARAEGVSALQQAGDHVAEVGNLIDLPTGPVAWARSTSIRDDDGYSIGSDEPEVHWGPTCPEEETDWLPLYALPQQPALVEQGVEKILAQHEPAACGEGTLPSPSTDAEPPCPKRGEIRVIDGRRMRFIERELEGDKWEVLG